MDTPDQHSLWLRRSADGSVSFVSPTEALAIPTRCARRCELIEDLAGVQDGSDVDLPLPLSMSEVKAWLACAQKWTIVVNSAHTGLNLDDHTVTDALQVWSLSVVIPAECDIVR